MGTKSDELYEEATKVKSPAEIDEMLRQARSGSGSSSSEPPPFHGDQDFEAHTQIGQLSELARQSLMVEDPVPPPVMPRASANVIRRATSPHPVARASAVMAAVPAGSLPDMAKTDDEEVAFEPWTEFAEPVAPQQTGPTLTEPTPSVAPPAIEAVASVQSKIRVGLVAWVVLLLVTIGVGTMGYMRITELENELAMAKAALHVKRVK